MDPKGNIWSPHRAGAYTANTETLVALQRNGILLDSSLFWRYPHNRLGGLGLPRNLPSHYGDIVEIPVTAYLREDRPTYMSGRFAPVTSIRKIDPNWFINAAEAKATIDGVLAANIPVVVVFLHSYSFMTSPAGSGAPVADRTALEVFRVILEQVASHGLPVTTMRNLADEKGALPRSAADVVPQVGVSVPVPTYVWHRMKALGRAAKVTGASVAALIACAVFVLRRRRVAPRAIGAADAAVLARTRVGVQ
jgi:hypothetical protein